MFFFGGGLLLIVFVIFFSKRVGRFGFVYDYSYNNNRLLKTGWLSSSVLQAFGAVWRRAPGSYPGVFPAQGQVRRSSYTWTLLVHWFSSHSCGCRYFIRSLTIVKHPCTRRVEFGLKLQTCKPLRNYELLLFIIFLADSWRAFF